MLPNFFPWRSLKSRVLILTLGIFLLSLWSLSWYASRMLQVDLQTMLSQQQFASVSQLATQINDELEDRLQSLEIIAASLSPASLQNPALLQTALEQQTYALRLFNGGIFATDAQGTAVADAPHVAGRIGTNYRDRSTVAAPLKDGRAMIGKPALGKKLLAPIFSISVPIRDRQGTVQGVLVGTVNLGLPNFLTSILNSRYGQTGGYLLVAPQHQLIVTATDKSRTMQPTPATGLNPMHDKYAKGFEGYGASLDAAGVPELSAAKGIPAAGWFLAAKLPTAEAFAPISAVQLRMLWATLMLTVLTGGLTWWVLKRQLAPMQRAARAVALQSLSDQPLQPLLVQHQDEIGDLILGFNRLLAIVGLRETALLESEQRFRNLIDHNNAVILQIDPATGQILEANASASVFYGWTRAQLRAMNIQDINALAPREIEDQLAVAASGKRNYFVFLHHLANGETRNVEVHCTTIASGNQTILVSIVHDITQRILVEQQIDLLMHEQLAILNSRIVGIVKLKDRKYAWTNAAFDDMLGYGPGELIGQSSRILYPTDQAFEAFAQVAYPVLQRGEIYRAEIEYPRKDQSLGWFEISGALLDQGTKGSIWACIDITERKRMQTFVVSAMREAATAKAQAEAANRAKSRFLAAASHDLRQPLAALSLYVGILKRQTTPANTDLVARIEDCGNSLSELLTDLLDVSKFEAGVVTPKLSDFAIDDVLGALFTVHHMAAQDKELHLRWRHTDLTVRCDAQLLSRIVGNLLSNAIRFTQQGGVLIACRRHQGRWWVEVWDTGIGIAADQTGVIFQEFHQLGDNARNRGSGLGLAIVAKAAALLGLEIRLRSRPGRGSMFAVALPLTVGSTPTIDLPAAPTLKPVRIALVEDHPEVLRALQLALESAGHAVVAAASGPALMDLLGTRTPDIVISDYRLGDNQTGFGVIAQARATFGAALPALLITGDTDPDLIRRMSEQGIAVLFKPLQIEALLAAIGAATAA